MRRVATNPTHPHQIIRLRANHLFEQFASKFFSFLANRCIIYSCLSYMFRYRVGQSTSVILCLPGIKCIQGYLPITARQSRYSAYAFPKNTPEIMIVVLQIAAPGLKRLAALIQAILVAERCLPETVRDWQNLPQDQSFQFGLLQRLDTGRCNVLCRQTTRLGDRITRLSSPRYSIPS